MGGLHRGEEAERRKRPVSHAFFSQPGGILSDNHFSPGTVTSHSQLQSRTPENDWFLEPVGGLAEKEWVIAFVSVIFLQRNRAKLLLQETCFGS